MNMRELQQRLAALGYEVGPLDGIMGRRTMAAIKAFQKSKGLDADGIAGPKTIAALTPTSASVPHVAPDQVKVELPWMAEAYRRKGLRERADKSKLWAWLKSDGGTVGDPTQNPWCGDFIETAIALTLPEERLPTNPYLARNWQTFGVQCLPRFGAIMVFWRGSRNGSSGHVAFCVGEDASAWHILGGNQSDAVTETRIAKSRLLAARWPKTFPLVGVGKVIKSAKGALSTNEA